MRYKFPGLPGLEQVLAAKPGYGGFLSHEKRTVSHGIQNQRLSHRCMVWHTAGSTWLLHTVCAPQQLL